MRQVVTADELRSIPACAGEAARGLGFIPYEQVYPRVCGGSLPARLRLLPERGLSPRVRGKRLEWRHTAFGGGSIPACAGEASASCWRNTPSPVYPRVCGGSSGGGVSLPPTAGLSPRVRGKRTPARGAERRLRSIPACAGEALARNRRRERDTVYPRVCGGSCPPQDQHWIAAGLSPRVRGKPAASAANLCRSRSIPACAGEAGHSARRRPGYEVYPRVCGGSPAVLVSLSRRQGLSPRVRGKRGRLCAAQLVERSIPACAGEAIVYGDLWLSRRVYPRVCGGSPPGRHSGRCRRGLSPRVRGKLATAGVKAGGQGSIPACAGEA